jgi:hypothetical protein
VRPVIAKRRGEGISNSGISVSLHLIHQHHVMPRERVEMKLKYAVWFLVLIWPAHPLITRAASAVTAEVARKCDILTAKAFPPRVPGNPAAGLVHGTGREASEYFRKCVDNAGNVDGSDEGQAPQGAK